MIRQNLKAALLKSPPVRSEWLRSSLFAISGAAIASLIWTVAPAKLKPPLIEAMRLHYENAMIGHELRINSENIVPGQWTAEINRGDKVLCFGSDESPYEPRPPGTVKWYTPSEWTGSKCPLLQAGDVAIATWRSLIGRENQFATAKLIIK